MSNRQVVDLDYNAFLVVASRYRDWLPYPNLLGNGWYPAAYDLRSAEGTGRRSVM